MKIKNNYSKMQLTSFVEAVCVILFLLPGIEAKAQTSVTMTLQNANQISPNTFDYDMMITNTSATTLALRGYSFGVNTTTGLANGGTLTQTFLSRNPAFINNIPQVVSAVSNGELRGTTVLATYGNEVNLTSGNSYLLARMRVHTTAASFPINFNPWLPASPLTTLQLVTAIGYTQCLAQCLVDAGPPYGYTIYGTGNPLTSFQLNTLTGVVAPSPTGASPFILNPSSTCSLDLLVDLNISCPGANDGAIFASTAASGTWMFGIDGGPLNNSSGEFNGLAPGAHTICASDGSNTCCNTITLTDPDPLAATIYVDTEPSCLGSDGTLSVVITGGTNNLGGYVTEWKDANSVILNSDPNALTVTNLPAGDYSLLITDDHTCSLNLNTSLGLTSVAASSTPILCNGGSSTISAVSTASSVPITYKIGTTALPANFTAGIYIVTATDANGCTKTTSITITEPPAITATISASTNVSCNSGTNGSATVNASGGTGTLSYAWAPTGGSNASTNSLIADTYTVTVTDANSCTKTTTVTITQPTSALTASSTQTNVSCFGGANGTATITASGGTSPYTGTGTFTGLAAGTYNYTVTDANLCTSLVTVTITQPSSIAPEINVQGNSVSIMDGDITPSATDNTDFGNVPVNTNLVQTYTIQNTGSANLTIPLGGITISGVDANLFTAGGITLPATISGPSGSATFTITFSPTTIGLKTATVTILNNDCDEGNYDFAIQGTGTSANSVLFTLTNMIQKAPNVFEYDMYCTNTGTTAMALRGYSWGLNHTTGLANGGIITHSFITRSGALSNIPTVTAGYTASLNHLRVSTNNAGLGNEVPLTIGTPVLLGTMRVTTSAAAFPQNFNPFLPTNPLQPIQVVNVAGRTQCVANMIVTPPGSSFSINGLANTASAATLQALTAIMSPSSTGATPFILNPPCTLTASIGSVTNVNCFGSSTGSASVTANAGTTPYSYAWAPNGSTSANASGLAAGTYTVNVTDVLGCTASTTVTITQPASALTTSSTQTNVSCFGGTDGTATITASGGASPYSGTGTFSGLVAGIHNYTVTDANLCTTIVTVTITQPPLPTITCPANISVNNTPNQCTANVTYNATVTGTPTPTVSYVFSGATTGSGNSNGSGATFNKGITTVTLTATNVCGTGSCSFTVTVNDNEAPTLICPGNQTMNVIANTCAATYIIADPVSDNCTGATWSYSLSGATTLSSSAQINDGTNSGTISFNKGITNVTLHGKDASNNNAVNCSFTVTVNDNQLPTLTCPGNQTMNVIANTCANNYTIADPVSDNCTGATWSYSLSGATTLSSSAQINDGTNSGTISFNKGITIVTLNGTDGTNNATPCTFTVTVIDNEAPVAICQAVTLTLNAQGQATLLPSQVNNGSTDNCGITSMTVSKTNFDCSDVRNNTALNLDASADRVETNSNANIPIGNSARTFSAWIKTSSTNTFGGLISQDGGTGGDLFSLWLSNNHLHFRTLGNDFESSFSAANNTWTFVAITYNGTNLFKMYMNGISETFSFVGPTNTLASKFYVGVNTFGGSIIGQYNGKIDEVQVFNKELTAAELASVRIGGNPAPTNRVLYYPFNEGTGTTITDASGNNNNATLLNPTGTNWVAPGPSEVVNTENVTLTVTDASNLTAQCNTTVNVVDGFPGVYLSAKVILDGPYDASTGWMRDSLRFKNLIPTNEPYSATPYNKLFTTNETVHETVSPSVLATTGQNAIVDWVYVELRSATNSSTVLYTKRALLQRDGDIVSSDDGVSPVYFKDAPFNTSYYVSIKHRNHLGVMSASPVYLTNCRNNNNAVVFNFITSPVLVTMPYHNSISPILPTESTYYPYHPQKIVPGVGTIPTVNALWAGDANNNKNLKNNGLSNDQQSILDAIGGTGNINGTLPNVYRMEDVNMDGKIRYNGPDNDKSVILNNIGISVPNNLIYQQTPN